MGSLLLYVTSHRKDSAVDNLSVRAAGCQEEVRMTSETWDHPETQLKTGFQISRKGGCAFWLSGHVI